MYASYIVTKVLKIGEMAKNSESYNSCFALIVLFTFIFSVASIK